MNNKDIILRKAIIDEDCKTIIDNKSYINCSSDLEDFCERNSDICFVLNQDGNGYLYQTAMRTILMQWSLGENALFRTLNNIKNNLVASNDVVTSDFLIENICWIAYNNNNDIPLYFKKDIINLCKIKKRPYQKLLNAFTKRGEIDSKFIEDNKTKIIPRLLSRNLSCPLNIFKDLNFVSEENFDWFTVSTRQDLTKEFVYTHRDNLIFEAILYYNKNFKDLILGSTGAVMSKFIEANDNLEYAKDQELYINELKLENFCKIGTEKWEKIHMKLPLSETFILMHLTKLNLNEILKYYNHLSDSFRESLEDYIKGTIYNCVEV